LAKNNLNNNYINTTYQKFFDNELIILIKFKVSRFLCRSVYFSLLSFGPYCCVMCNTYFFYVTRAVVWVPVVLSEHFKSSQIIYFFTIHNYTNLYNIRTDAFKKKSSSTQESKENHEMTAKRYKSIYFFLCTRRALLSLHNPEGHVQFEIFVRTQFLKHT
jgi:hypothetical protein